MLPTHFRPPSYPVVCPRNLIHVLTEINLKLSDHTGFWTHPCVQTQLYVTSKPQDRLVLLTAENNSQFLCMLVTISDLRMCGLLFRQKNILISGELCDDSMWFYVVSVFSPEWCDKTPNVYQLRNVNFCGKWLCHIVAHTYTQSFYSSYIVSP